MDKGYDTILTAGAQQSNHCRQTAAACAKAGLECHLLLGGKKPENARITLFPAYGRYSNEIALRATQKYYDLAKAHNLSLTQMALAFVTSRPFLTSNIIGATSMDQLKENIGSIHVELSEEVLQGIEAIHNEIPNPAP